MKKSSLVLLIFIAALCVLYGQDNRPRLAILPFTGTNIEDAESIAEFFSFEPEINRAFIPVPRTRAVENIMREQQFQRSGLTDSDTIAELGRQMNADYVLAGHITALGQSSLLLITIIHVEELRQVAGDYREYRRIEDTLDMLPDMARRISSAIRLDASALPRLAVLPFNVLSSGVDQGDAEVLAQILATDIANSGTYAVFPRTSTIEQVLAEHDIQRTGMTDQESIRRIGAAVNADYILSANVRSLGSIKFFSAAILHVESGGQQVGAAKSYENVHEGLELMSELAVELAPALALAPEPAALPAPVPPPPAAAPAPAPAPVPPAIVQAAAVDYSRAGLYANGVYEGAKDLNEALLWIKYNFQNNGDYVIVLGQHERLTDGMLTYSNMNVNVSLKASGGQRNILFNSARPAAPLFTVGRGVTFTIEEGIILSGDEADITEQNARNLVRINGGTFVMNGGRLVNNRTTAVFMESGNFTMNDGTISGNRSISGGGGVHLIGGSFTMLGNASVRGNSSTITSILNIPGANSSSGGGVYVAGGTFIMQDNASVSGNTSNSHSSSNHSSSHSSSGGGVYVARGGIFTMEDNASVHNNTSISYSASANRSVGSSNSGGGVYVGGTFIMHDNASVYGNTGSAGSNNGAVVQHISIIIGHGVIVAGGTFRISGGIVYGNDAGIMSNTAIGNGSALQGSGQYGTFNGSSFTRIGDLSPTNNTIRVVNGVLQR